MSSSTTSAAPHAAKNTKKKRFKRKSNPEGQMTLVAHLQELRRRIIISVVWLVIGSVAGFMWYQHSIFGLESLGEILRGPYCSLPPEKRASLTLDGQCRLIATKPFEMFLLRIKIGALAGTVFASPVWLYQIWAFITPGLKKNERKWTFAFVFSAVLLFVTGALLAYFVVAYGLDLLLTIGGEAQVAALSGGEYFNFILALLLIFGVSFEVPLLIAMLNIVGLLTYDAMKDKRRVIILGLFIFAAFITPGQDPYSMLALACALSVLVELAIQFCRINDKRRNVERPAWMDLDDESSSALDEAPSTIGASSPLADASAGSSPLPKPEPIPPSAGQTKPNYFDDII